MIKNELCNFCLLSENKIILERNNVSICALCLDRCSNYLDKGIVKDKKNFLSPKHIKDFLDKYVIGQNDAKSKLSIVAFKHLFIKEKVKSHLMLYGPSGSGKTYMIETLLNFLNIPFVIEDCSSLTPSGFIGDSVETVIQKLYYNAEMNIEKTQTGVVVFDEIDKIDTGNGAKSNNNISSSFSVQPEFLRLMEGKNVKINKNEGMNFHNNSIMINTKNILFIFSGAFTNFNNIVSNSYPIFNFSGEQVDTNINEMSLIDYGFLPEFLGRISYFSNINALTFEEIKQIYISTHAPIINEYKLFFDYFNINLNLSDEIINYIIKKSSFEKFGARSLRQTTNKELFNFMFNIKKEEKRINLNLDIKNEEIIIKNE